MKRFLLGLLFWIGTLFWFVVMVFVLGCGEHRDPKVATNPWHNDETEFVLLLVVDADYVAQDSRPYEFMCYAISTYFQDRQGEGGKDQIIVSQLGSDKPVLYQSIPEDFKKDFPSPTAFYEYLQAKKRPVTRSKNAGIAFSIDYLAHHPSVESKQARSVTLIISDMEDKTPSPEDEEKAVQAFIRYSKSGGAIGYYWCSQTRLAAVRDQMERAGISFYRLESDAHGHPPLPSFE